MIIKLKTWSCECGYNQDFPPTQELMNLHFNEDKKFDVFDVEEGECPSCALAGKRKCLLKKEDDPSKKVTVTILDEENINQLVKHKGEIRTRESAIQINESEETEYYKALVKEKMVQATLEEKSVDVQAMKVEHPFTPDEMLELTNEEKDKVKAQIQADIEKFTLLEDK